MSRENVEIVRRLYADGGPFALPMGPDEERALLHRLFAEYYEDQVEVRMPADYPEGEQVLYGKQGMSRLLAMLRDSWTEFRFDPERFIDAGDHVVVLIRVIARGGASGLATERKTAHVWTVRDGRLSSIQVYRDREDAFEALKPRAEPVPGAVVGDESPQGDTGRAMSPENVDLVRRAIEAYNQRDLDTIDALNDPEIEVDWSASLGLEPRVYRGQRQAMGFYRDLFDFFEQVDLQPERFVEAGDLVVVPNTARFRGRDGIDTVARSTLVFEVRRAHVTRVRLYQETNEALRAAGVRE